ncbi:hypothetical protein DSECCO2_602390 [anaerobic digester metagenome]
MLNLCRFAPADHEVSKVRVPEDTPKDLEALFQDLLAVSDEEQPGVIPWSLDEAFVVKR